MDFTSVSLLRRLREPERDAAWQRFVDLDAPLIFHWGKNHGLNATDAADLVQEVLAILVAKLPEFEYDPQRRFRGWLRTITLNKANDFHRRNSVRPNNGNEDAIQNVAVAAEVDLFDEAEYRSFLVRQAMKVVQTEFPEHAWKACWDLVVEGQTGAAVANRLGISVSATYVSKPFSVGRVTNSFLTGL